MDLCSDQLPRACQKQVTFTRVLAFGATVVVLIASLSVTSPEALAHDDEETTTSSDDQSAPGADETSPPNIEVQPLPAGSDCREMTDSIVRLYQAYFGREPGVNEMRSTTDAYRSGEKSLEQISQQLSTSTEFNSRVGEMTDRGFVLYAVDQTLGRAATEKEITHWTTSLDNDYPRGSVMLAFSESAEFVAATETVKPLSGYNRRYPDGTHWYCGSGSAKFGVQPLVGEKLSSDFLFDNSGGEPSETELWVLERNLNQTIQMSKGSIPPNFTDYNWDGLFTGDGNYGSGLDVRTNEDTRWIIVFYPRSIGEQRPGWELGEGTGN